MLKACSGKIKSEEFPTDHAKDTCDAVSAAALLVDLLTKLINVAADTNSTTPADKFDVFSTFTCQLENFEMSRFATDVPSDHPDSTFLVRWMTAVKAVVAEQHTTSILVIKNAVGSYFSSEPLCKSTVAQTRFCER